MTIGFSFKSAWTVARRDFRSYFSSPIAYVVLTVFLLLVGYFFYQNLWYFHQSQAQFGQYGAGRQMSLSDGIIRPVFQNMNVILLMVLPFITMRLLAEEKRNHTLELLITSPLRLSEIVFGKFLSAFLFVLVMLAATAPYPITLAVLGDPELLPILSTYLGSALLGGCYVATGVFASALTENQIVAAVLNFGFSLLFWVINWGANSAGPFWAETLNHLSLINHWNPFSQGTVSTVDVVFYLSYIFFGLFLTHRVLDSYRWR